MNSPFDAQLGKDVVSMEEADVNGKLPLNAQIDKPQPSALTTPELSNKLEPETPTKLEILTRMLVVDDLPVNRKLIGIQLQKLGCQVDQAANGLEAVEKVKAGEYGVVFMDLDMPKMDGYQAAIEIRQHDLETGQHTPIIGVTSYEQEPERQQCVSAGMDAYISKGVTAKKLNELVQRFKRSKRVMPVHAVSELSSKVNGVEIDIELLQSSDDPIVVDEIIDISIGTMKTLVSCLKCAIEDRDIISVIHFAQSFKEPCATMRLNSTAKLAARICSDAERSNWVQAEQGMVLLESQYCQVLEQLTGLSAIHHRSD